MRDRSDQIKELSRMLKCGFSEIDRECEEEALEQIIEAERRGYNKAMSSHNTDEAENIG